MQIEFIGSSCFLGNTLDNFGALIFRCLDKNNCIIKALRIPLRINFNWTTFIFIGAYLFLLERNDSSWSGAFSFRPFDHLLFKECSPNY